MGKVRVGAGIYGAFGVDADATFTYLMASVDEGILAAKVPSARDERAGFNVVAGDALGGASPRKHNHIRADLPRFPRKASRNPIDWSVPSGPWPVRAGAGSGSESTAPATVRASPKSGRDERTFLALIGSGERIVTPTRHILEHSRYTKIDAKKG